MGFLNQKIMRISEKIEDIDDSSSKKAMGLPTDSKKGR
jgi:DNA anti-recombination protein RmuC